LAVGPTARCASRSKRIPVASGLGVIPKRLAKSSGQGPRPVRSGLCP
jgi:hypothetical protein